MQLDPVELVGGLAAGLTKDILLHPVDTLRARLDVTRSGTASPVGAMVGELRAVHAADGLAGLYRGYTLCLVGSTPASALYFGSYHAIRRVLVGGDVHGSHPMADSGAGAGAEAVASLVWTPLDVLKQRMQVGPAGMGVADAARGACEGVGIIGLWRGYFAGLCVWAPFSAAYFASYEAFRDAFRASGGHDGSEGANAAQSASAGAAAGGVAAIATQPLDCAKTRIQVGLSERSLGIFGVARQVWAEEGVASLFRGGLARALWLAPGCAVTITVFEAVTAELRRR